MSFGCLARFCSLLDLAANLWDSVVVVLQRIVMSVKFLCLIYQLDELVQSLGKRFIEVSLSKKREEVYGGTVVSVFWQCWRAGCP